MYVHSLLLLSCNRSQPRKFSFSFKDTTTTEIYTLSLHDALPISKGSADVLDHATSEMAIGTKLDALEGLENPNSRVAELRSEEHTSELQSRENLVCRLLLEKKKKKNSQTMQKYDIDCHEYCWRYD